MRGKRDWFKTVLHFICGAILGGILGLVTCWWWMDSDVSRSTVIVFLSGGALVFGVLAGLFLDSFWDWLKDEGQWFLPW